MDRVGHNRDRAVRRRPRGLRRRCTAASRRLWTAALASLVVVRVALPLLVLAAAGHDLPGLPPYDYAPLVGDANGVYAESRELNSLVAFGPAGAVALLVLAVGAAAVWRFWARSGSRSRPAALQSHSPRARSSSTSRRAAPLSSAGRCSGPSRSSAPSRRHPRRGPRVRRRARRRHRRERGHGRRDRVHRPARHGQPRGRRRCSGPPHGLAAAHAPAGRDERLGNGQWNVDVGLVLYTEPISTALVAAAIALLLAPALDSVRLASAGALLGFATVVRPSNRLFAAAAVMLLVLADRRPEDGAGGNRRGRHVRAARRGLLAEGLSDDRERARLPLARPGQIELDRPLLIDPERAPSCPARRSSTRSRLALECCRARRRARDQRRVLPFYEHAHLHPRYLFSSSRRGSRSRRREPGAQPDS